MPGFDRNGPMGAGPMTGGGRGRCNSAKAGIGGPYAGGYGRGLGLRRGFRGGFNRGMGAGRAFGRGFGRGFGRYPATAFMEPTDEIDMLKAEADDMQRSLDLINERIRTLEDKPAEKS